MQQDPVRVKTYYGQTPDESARQFQADAATAAVNGYIPTSQAWNGPALTVTYVHRTQYHRGERPAWNWRGIGAAIAGGIGGVAAFLPWVSVTTGGASISVTGLASGADGPITIILSIGLVLAGIGMTQGRPRTTAWVSGLLLSLALVGITILDVVTISNRIVAQTGPGSSAYASIGVGLWLTGVAGLIGGGASMMAATNASS